MKQVLRTVLTVCCAIECMYCVKYDMTSMRHDNKCLADGFWNFTAPSFVICLLHCQFFSACSSVSFFRESNICEMNEATAAVNPAGFLEAPGVFYGEKEQIGPFDQMVPSGCRSRPCQGRAVCHAAGEGHICVIEDCGLPVERPYVTYSPTARPHRVGSSITYTCTAPYRFISGSQVDMCSPEGVWEPGTYTCTVCDPPPNYIYESYTSVQTADRTVVRYTCNCPEPNYAWPPHDDATIQCQSDGTWSPKPFHCRTDCYNEPARDAYMGVYNQTETGAPCQRWDTDSPHENKMASGADVYIDGDIHASKNWCRDPGSGTPYFAPWCYTNIPGEPRWEFCGVPLCSDCL